jgi:hypothetical protein
MYWAHNVNEYLYEYEYEKFVFGYPLYPYISKHGTADSSAYEYDKAKFSVPYTNISKCHYRQSSLW